MNSTQSRVLRVVGVTGLVVGPLTLIVATVLQLVLQAAEPSATMFETVAHHQSLWLFMGAVGVLGLLVWLAGIPAAIGLARDRGWILTSIGGVVTAIGLASGVGHLSVYYSTFSVLAADGVSAHSRTVLERAAESEPLANALLLIFLVGFSLGPILMTIGLRRARIVAVWVPVAAIVATVADFVGGPVAGAIQLAALVLTFAPIVIAVLRQRSQAPAVSSGRSAARASVS